MLKQRIITALAMLAVVLLCLLAPWHWPFMALLTLALGVASWEWARLNGMPDALAIAVGAGFVAVAAVATVAGVAQFPLPGGFWLVCCLMWLAGAVWTLHAGTQGWQAVPRSVRLLAGLVLFAVVWLAVLRAFALGINYLLSLMALVWAADIGAYFAGRAFGQKLVARKLAPRVSPGKSWEGVLGGMVAVLLLAALWLSLDGRFAQQWGHSFYGMLRQHSLIVLVAVCVVLAGMSVVGDLFESLVKRAAGAKDSSHVLPGHGGVLDRIDGLLPIMPMGMLVIAWLAGTA
ncbi:hypothetical protein AAV94_14105 [Lampropedia cohaerens]|uniref:Phosphatidate cytidylyltransferase n=1 Tax=Lampropedia cohaerens TaxID=1610491 RepID=A0A0U1PWG4_9BURK|nr:phosphatidate cytidylyltransferase [Lampropedia cohaerens]KKW66859.1 hypothetical protein AAV94_14105 [Lampropedia cohaerens]